MKSEKKKESSENKVKAGTTIEEAFTALEELLKEMDNPELPIEEAFKKYNIGLELVNYCNGSIEQIEHQITILEENQ